MHLSHSPDCGSWESRWKGVDNQIISQLQLKVPLALKVDSLNLFLDLNK